MAGLLLPRFALYGLSLTGLVWFLQRFRATRRRATLWGFLLFGLASGILAVWLWPADSCVLPNALGVWLGDWIYVHAIEWLGNPHSAQAHETIPWALRVPQVYGIASTGLGAVVGLVLQWLKNPAAT